MSNKKQSDVDLRGLEDSVVNVMISMSLKELVRLMQAIDKGDPALASKLNTQIIKALETAIEGLKDEE